MRLKSKTWGVLYLRIVEVSRPIHWLEHLMLVLTILLQELSTHRQSRHWAKVSYLARTKTSNWVANDLQANTFGSHDECCSISRGHRKMLILEVTDEDISTMLSRREGAAVGWTFFFFSLGDAAPAPVGVTGEWVECPTSGLLISYL
jgi:hypothetical protein